MSLTETLNRIDQLKVEADALRPVSKENLARLNQKLRLDWSYHSNAIEGNTLTLSETKMLIVHGYHMGGKLGRHYEEMKLHNDVLLVLEDLVRNNEMISEVLIRNLHKQMMGDEYWIIAYDSNNNEIRVKGRPGEYKNSPNMVRTESGEYKYFSTVEETPSMMHDLIQWYRDEEAKKILHPVMIAATFHYRFVSIHPFDDGNGRMARILMNLILMRHGFVPAIIRLNDREKYIKALALAQDGGSLEPFIEHVAEETQKSLQLLIKAAKGESIEEPDDIDKQIALLKTKLEKNKPALPKSKEVVADSYLKSIKPLFEKARQKLSKFDDFFTSSNISYWVNSATNNKENDTIEYIDKRILYPYSSLSLKDFTEGEDNIVLKDTKENIDNLWVEFTWLGFNKAGILNFDYKTTIRVDFENLKYSISISGNVPNEKILLYNEYLEEKEIGEIVNTMAKEFLQYIESKIEAFNNSKK